MVAVEKPKASGYAFEPTVEAQIVAACLMSQKFWGKVGYEIDPEALDDPIRKIVMRACKQIGKESGRGPASPLIVLQRIRNWHNSGKHTAEELQRVRECLTDSAEDFVVEQQDALIAEIAPLVGRRIQKVALQAGVDIYGKHGDLAPVIKLLNRVQRIGVVDTSASHRLGRGLFRTVLRISDTQRLSTGIPDLDAPLQDGIKRGTYTVIMGATNAGKSQMANHIAAESISFNIPVAYASLEMTELDTYSRMIANLVELPTTDILRYPEVLAEAERRIGMLEDDGLLGFATVKQFTPTVTTIEDIFEWHAEQEKLHEVIIPVLIIDSANDVSCREKLVDHKQQERISGMLRDHSSQRNMWDISTAQANAEGMDTKKTKVLDNHHAAHSKGIPRACDLLVTLNPREEEGLLYNIAKNRHGPKGAQIGPLPTEFEFGRCVPVSREGWPRF